MQKHYSSIIAPSDHHCPACNSKLLSSPNSLRDVKFNYTSLGQLADITATAPLIVGA